MRRNAIPFEQIAAWHARHLAGETVQAVAESTGRSSASLYDLFKSRGLTIVKHPKTMPLRVSGDRIEAMHAAYSCGLSLAAVARQFGRSSTAVRELFKSRGLEVRPVVGKAKRTERGRIAPAEPISDERVEQLIQEVTSLKIPTELKLDWRKWSIARRAEYIRRVRARLRNPNDRPELPFSANITPFDYGSIEAHAIAPNTRIIKPCSQGVIYRGDLWYWVANTGYVNGPWIRGAPERILSRKVWEDANGRRIPPRHVISLIDRNPNNLDPSNLELLPRQELRLRNRYASAIRREREVTSAALDLHRNPNEHDLISQIISAH